jgi:hypothetical protein
MSPAALLINALTPAQRAFLHTALESYSILNEEGLEYTFSKEYTPVLARHIIASHKFCIKEIKEIKELLFAECFPEDLKLEKYVFDGIKNTTPHVAVVS